MTSTCVIYAITQLRGDNVCRMMILIHSFGHKISSDKGLGSEFETVMT